MNNQRWLSIIVFSATIGSLIQSQDTSQLPGVFATCKIGESILDEYSPDYSCNPFYIRVDSHGDKQLESAVLAKNNATGKRAVLILREKDCKLTIVGGDEKHAIRGKAGTIIDMSADYIDIISKKDLGEMLQQNRRKEKALGEGIALCKEESECGYLFWNGSRWDMTADEGLYPVDKGDSKKSPPRI